jgi:tRNA(fMet)-specific endonuclease VapC
MRYTLDADWVINALAKKRRADSVLKELGSQVIGISIITLGELYEGPLGTAHPESNLAALREFLGLFSVIQVTEPIMERFARIRYHLRRQGNLIPDLDLLIAATALELDLTVLTFDVGHFERIPDLKLYPSE